MTPLEYASTPNLDELAKMSACGLMTPLQEGVSLGTDLAHYLLFGYALETYPNRAVIDAIGEAIKFDEKTLILRASFAYVEEDDLGYMIQSRFTDGLTDVEIKQLIESIDCEVNGYRFRCVHSYDSHCFVLVESEAHALSSALSDSDPFYAPQYVMRVEPFETELDEAYQTAKAINTFLKRTHGVLSSHRINLNRQTRGHELGNFILTKWAGKWTKCPTFFEQNGMRGTLIGKSKLLKGVSDYMGLTYQGYETFEQAVEMALACDSDYVHLHTKAPDEASHKKDPFLKVKAIEAIDKQIKPLLGFDGLLVVTADHSTPCSGEMIHSGESVPFMARGKYVRRDRVRAFNEMDCGQGGLRLTGSSFMKYIQNATDRGQLYHLRTGRKRRNFRSVEVNRP
jgi:2,3-bisphosphoglycerate-independent phosphoglycerate mutase